MRIGPLVIVVRHRDDVGLWQERAINLKRTVAHAARLLTPPVKCSAPDCVELHTRLRGVVFLAEAQAAVASKDASQW